MAARGPLAALVLGAAGAMAQETCYGGGSIAGAVFGTLLATLALLGLAYLFYRYYWKARKDRHLVLASDPENVKDEFAFDNAGFKGEGPGWLRAQRPPALAAPAKAAPAPAAAAACDDSLAAESQQESVVVPLWSRDFTGLGFEVQGGMRDGIFISSVLRGGPAYESGRIHTGARINSVSISFRHMVLADAVAILSYASPYELQLHVAGGGVGGGRAGRSLDRRAIAPALLRHPAVQRPHASHTDLQELEKATRQNHFPKPASSPNSTLDSSNQSKNTLVSGNKKSSGATLERSKSPVPEYKDSHITTLERENEKNERNSKIYAGDIHNQSDITKPEQNRNSGSSEMTQVISTVSRMSSPPDVIIIKDGGDRYKNEKAEVQKKESITDTGKKGMKFGIRVLPPNVPDDGTINMINARNSKIDGMKSTNENGNIVAEIRSIDEVDKNFENMKSKENSISKGHEGETKKPTAPVVAKRREKQVAPIPNARNIANSAQAHIEVKMEPTQPKVIDYDISDFNRNDDLNSSGIKRDSQGIPQEIPQHMMEAAMFARSNRKSSSEILEKQKILESKKLELAIKNEKETAAKNAKKSKGKAPSPPESNSSKIKDDFDVSCDTDLSSTTQDTVISAELKSPLKMNFTDDFVDHQFSDINMQNVTENNKYYLPPNDANRSDDMILGKSSINTSTPKVEKVVKRMRPDIPIQKPLDLNETDLDLNMDSFQKKETSDSLNNFFEDSKSNVSSTLDANSAVSLSQDSFASNTLSELGNIITASTTIELNSSEITIHSSPTESDNAMKDMEENERKAASLGDLSKLEPAEKANRKTSQGTLERAQSLDISSEDAKIQAQEKHIAPKKRKSNSVFDGSYHDHVSDETPLDSNESVNLVHSKEPRLSLNISNISMDGLNTFQRNRLKKASEWGNMEDAIMMKKDMANISHSGSSEIANSAENLSNDNIHNVDYISKALQEENNKLNEEIEKLKFVPNTTTITGESTQADKMMQRAFESDNKNIASTVQDVVGSTDLLKSKKDAYKTPSEGTSTSVNIEQLRTSIPKPEIPSRIKPPMEITEIRPNFEIGTYISDSPAQKYKTDTTINTSSRLSPKLEDKLTMIYETNIPDDIKVSRHSLVSSLERPKSDLMKKLLAQNPALNVNVDAFPQPETNKKNTDITESGESSQVENVCLESINSELSNEKTMDGKTNATSFTLLNQPDIVNLRIKQNGENVVEHSSLTGETEFVSNINIVGTTSKSEASKINFQFENTYPSSPEKVQTRNFFSTSDNVVTITTDGSQPSSIIMIEGDTPAGNQMDNFRNSIEINASFDKLKETKFNEQDSAEQTREVEIPKGKNNVECYQTTPIVSSSSKTYLMEESTNEQKFASAPLVFDTQTTNLPTQKTVTVNVTEDEHGNKIITQNVEETISRVVTITSSAPIEIEQYTFGVIKNPTAADIQRIEESDISERVDPSILMEIERQNPNIKFVSTEPIITNTETMMIDANLTQEETKVLLAKLKDNPQIISGTMPGHNHGTIIQETKMIVDDSGDQFDGQPIIKMTQASYKFNIEDELKNPSVKIVKMIESSGTNKTQEDDTASNITSEMVQKMIEKINKSNGEPKASEILSVANDTKWETKNTDLESVNRMDESSQVPAKEYITEIEVQTPQYDSTKSKADKENLKRSSLDISSMSDFLNNERNFSEKDKIDMQIYESFSPDSIQNGKDTTTQSNKEQMKRHSDFDLPRNTHIKFRTATYEPQTISPNKLSSSEKRLSQIEILKSNFEKGSLENLSGSSKPLVSSKPSNIPVKLPEKPSSPQKVTSISASKIPILNSQTQKSFSQEPASVNVHKTSPHGKLPAASNSSANISITSIKSSSRNPSGK